MTITEGLAELKTIEKRITKKREFVVNYATRPDGLRDPLEKDGGSVEVLKRELQAIQDLETRHIRIRTAIQGANLVSKITAAGITQSVAEWLIWRKEVVNGQRNFLANLFGAIQRNRQQTQQRGGNVVSATVSVGGETKPIDLLVNVDEKGLSKDAESLEEILGTLDGQLSVHNATTQIEV